MSRGVNNYSCRESERHESRFSRCAQDLHWCLEGRKSMINAVLEDVGVTIPPAPLWKSVPRLPHPARPEGPPSLNRRREERGPFPGWRNPLQEGANAPWGSVLAWRLLLRFSENHVYTRTLASFLAWHERSLECWPWVKFTLQKMMYFIWLQDRVLKTLLKQNSQSPSIQTVCRSKRTSRVGGGAGRAGLAGPIVPKSLSFCLLLPGKPEMLHLSP